LSAKVEDLKTVPEQPVGTNGEITSATEAANRALDEALNPGHSLSGPSTQVNDLSSMVRKKKKVAAEPEAVAAGNGTHLEPGVKSTGKRKAEDEDMADGATTPVEKKAKLAEEEEPASAPATN